MLRNRSNARKRVLHVSRSESVGMGVRAQGLTKSCRSQFGGLFAAKFQKFKQSTRQPKLAGLRNLLEEHSSSVM